VGLERTSLYPRMNASYQGPQLGPGKPNLVVHRWDDVIYTDGEQFNLVLETVNSLVQVVKVLGLDSPNLVFGCALPCSSVLARLKENAFYAEAEARFTIGGAWPPLRPASRASSWSIAKPPPRLTLPPLAPICR
jgi:hypothetical protein